MNGTRVFTVNQSIWKEFGIFPDVLARRADVEKVRKDAHEQFCKLGIGNLRILCEEFRVSYDQPADKRTVANVLASHFPQDLLVHAFEFQRRRSQAIQVVFQRRFEKPKSVVQRVAAFSSNGKETLDSFVRLLLLLNKSESNMKDVFYLASWLSRDTGCRFSVAGTRENKLCQRIAQRIDKLTEMLATCSDLGGERLGLHDLNGEAFVVVHLRKYRPRISRDYRTTHNLHHICGTLVLGVSHVDGCLHVKNASKNVADTVERFLVDELSLEAERVEERVAVDFDPEPLASILRGKIPQNSPFALRGISIRRTSIGGVPLAISRAPFNDAILGTLEALHDAGIILSASPVNLDTIEFDYKWQQLKVSCKHVSGGALRLTYQNSGMPEAFQETLENDFEATFAVPLNRQLDPSQWKLGTAGIIAFVLHAKTKEEIQDYQKHVYEELLAQKIIEERPEVLKVCLRHGCASNPVPAGADDAECRTCGGPLREQRLTVVSTSAKGMQQLLRSFLADNTKYGLGSRTLTFESQKYFPVTAAQGGVAGRIAGLFQQRISTEKQVVFDRASMPLVRFSEGFDAAPLRIERDDCAVVSLPYLLTSLFEEGQAESVRLDLEKTFERVISTYDSRASRAARISAERLESPPVEQDGDRYEVDVFNVLRWLFWYANRLGQKGKREPDGFLSLQDYRDSESPTDLAQWNLGYDAKFSRKAEGYDFGPEEHRQAEEYIRKYFRARKNSIRRSRRILGHAIISNNIAANKLERFVEHLRAQGVISAGEPSPVIVLLRDAFVTSLYRSLAAEEELFRKKRLHLHFLLIQLLEKASSLGFLELGKSAADWILEELDRKNVIEDSLRVEELIAESFSVPPDNIVLPQLEFPVQDASSQLG